MNNEGLIPKYKSSVEVVSHIYFESIEPQPNWWWRMWQYILLGWKWTNLEGKNG